MIAGEIDGLPAVVREEVVWAAFKDSDKPENVLGLADLLIDEEAWAKLEQRETVQQLQKAARHGAAREVADWAMTLPVREETTGAFPPQCGNFPRRKPGGFGPLAGIPAGRSVARPGLRGILTSRAECAQQFPGLTLGAEPHRRQGLQKRSRRLALPVGEKNGMDEEMKLRLDCGP